MLACSWPFQCYRIFSIRWMVKRDMPAVLEIEEKSFKRPWTVKDFIKMLKSPKTIAIVAEFEGVVVGYAVYSLYKNRIVIQNFAVDPKYRRQTAGTQLINALKNKLSERRIAVTAIVSEHNLKSQLFFKQLGFRSVRILHKYWAEEDGYLFRYEKEPA